ncbi:MAG: hypothetical protein J6Q89_04620, partial [Clostridia bacterium]|nr:hypothetical protein [Clostridia bacterium]
LTNGTGSPSTVTAGTSTALTLTPNSGYAFPYSGDITISGIYNSISYGINADNRVTTININRPTSNITITATFPAATYLVTWNLTNGMGSPSTVTGGNTETTLTLTPNDGYAFPASITLTGTASYDYNPATGIILVSSPRSDISIAANFQKTIASGTYFLPKIADLQGSPAFSIMTDNITLYYNNKTYATLDGVETADFVQLHIDKLGKDTLGLYFVDVETAPLGDNQYVIYLAANEYATSKYLYPLAYLYISNNITTGDAGVIAFFDNCYKVDNDLAYYTIYESAYPLVYEAALQYNLGYSAGYTDAANDNILADNTAGVITQIFSGIFGSVFSIELFPGFPIYLFILIPAVFAVFGLILWLIRGK